MARLILFLTALLLAMPAIADDDNEEGRGGEKKALRADCERQANQQNLIGKERRKFVKECSKEGKHAKRRGDGRGERRDVIVRPAPTQPPAQPATQPATPATPPPAATTPPQPAATPASPPPATTPAATPQPPKPVLTAEQKQANCIDEAKRANVVITARKQYIEKCMAR